uniref:Protein phosphatase 1 regulatory subunit 32 n=1 Tax=Monodelphis domestica TaxID=13616 RepID=A0A5F8GL87_MONDO
MPAHHRWGSWELGGGGPATEDRIPKAPVAHSPIRSVLECPWGSPSPISLTLVFLNSWGSPSCTITPISNQLPGPFLLCPREPAKDAPQSVYGQSYHPMELQDGRNPLPWTVYQSGSSYVRDKVNSCVPSKEVKKVHFNTQDYGGHAITGLEPKTVPTLHEYVGKGGIEMENYRYGPRFMTSEYNSKYRYEIPGQPDFLQKKTIGAKEDTGFTEQGTKNPIVPQSLPGEPVLSCNRSVSKSDFGSYSNPHVRRKRKEGEVGGREGGKEITGSPQGSQELGWSRRGSPGVGRPSGEGVRDGGCSRVSKDCQSSQLGLSLFPGG